MSRSSQVVTATTRNLLMRQRRRSLDARSEMGGVHSLSATAPRQLVQATPVEETIAPERRAKESTAHRAKECVTA
jgi:hypothetical protein